MSRSILFKPFMAKAIKEGKKKQTRRVVKGNPGDGILVFNHDQSEWEDSLGDPFACPYSIDEKIYVKETFYCWGKWVDYTDDKGKTRNRFLDLTDENHHVRVVSDYQDFDKGDFYEGIGYHKRPAIFMAEKQSQLWIRILKIRSERINSISNEDAMSEGIRQVSKDGVVKKYCVYDCHSKFDTSTLPWQSMPRNPVAAFTQLWDQINMDRGFGWHTNPLVFAFDFEIAEK